MWWHWITPCAGCLLANGQHRTWEAQFESPQLGWIAWVKKPVWRWRWVAYSATTVDAQWIVCNNIGGLNPKIGVNGWIKFSWLNYFDGFGCVAAYQHGQRQLIPISTEYYLLNRNVQKIFPEFLSRIQIDGFFFRFICFGVRCKLFHSWFSLFFSLFVVIRNQFWSFANIICLFNKNKWVSVSYHSVIFHWARTSSYQQIRIHNKNFS